MHHLYSEQFIPVSPEKAWEFFSNPHNLNLITPNDMSFKIIGELPDKMYEGMFIRYKLKPMLNIGVNWVTEITHIKENEFFVDEQRTGPYKIWHHEHHFKPVNNGVLMTDKLYYDIGKGFIGSIAGALFVHNKVKNIFNYRFKKVEELFGKTSLS